MGVGKGVIIAGAVGAGTVALLGALENTDADTIREFGNKVDGFVSGVSNRFAESEFVQDIATKLGGTQYGPQIMDAASGLAGATSAGFDILIDTLAKTKESAEANGTSFTTEAAGSLRGLVADGVDYVKEHLDEAKNLGRAVLGYDTPEPEQEQPEETPAIEV